MARTTTRMRNFLRRRLAITLGKLPERFESADANAAFMNGVNTVEEYVTR